MIIVDKVEKLSMDQSFSGEHNFHLNGMLVQGRNVLSFRFIP